MKKEVKKTDIEWSIFVDVWEFYQKFGIPEDGQDYWKAIVDAGVEIEKKYKGNILANRLYYAVIQALNEEYKEGKK